MEISWDSSWPDDKKAYYNARKKRQAAGKAKQDKKNAAEKASKVVGVKQEATKAQKIAALKKQLEDLEK